MEDNKWLMGQNPWHPQNYWIALRYRNVCVTSSSSGFCLRKSTLVSSGTPLRSHSLPALAEATLSVMLTLRVRRILPFWSTTDSLTELNTKFSQAGIERKLSHDLEVLRAVSFAFLLLEETISLVRLENSAKEEIIAGPPRLCLSARTTASSHHRGGVMKTRFPPFDLPNQVRSCAMFSKRWKTDSPQSTFLWISS